MKSKFSRHPARAWSTLLAATVFGFSAHAARADKAPAQTPIPLFSLAAPTSGRAVSALQNVAPTKRLGRNTQLKRASFGVLRRLKRGNQVSIPLYTGKNVTGVVETVQNDNGVLRLGGRLNGAKNDVFTLNIGKGEVSGLIQLTSQQSAFRVQNGTTATPVLQELPLSSVICYNFPRFAKGAQTAGRTAAAGVGAVPLLNSRPTATAQIFLDLDGETVNDPDWITSNGGQPIVMQPAGFSDTDVALVFNKVKEDYAPFNVNVTTDVAKYNAAPVGKRMRCIIGFGPDSFVFTKTTAGIAFVGSFADAGRGLASNVPCFVFVNATGGPGGSAEAAAHEVGHTMGLSHDGELAHDGKPVQGYYAGHACPTGGWAPIMGVGYYSAVVQWSKGEYVNANNQEDDLAIISATRNGFGYAPDEAGSTLATATPLTRTGNDVKQSGIIQQTGDIDIYSFTGEGTLNITLTGNGPSPDLDAQLELLDESGRVLQTSNPADQLGASITRSLTQGSYYLRVSGVGLNTPSTGYSNYDSLGAYTLTGTVPPLVPVFTLSGTVKYKDGSTETPLPGARVLLSNGLRTTSNAMGTYTIPGVNRGTYSVRAELPGYTFSTGSITFVGLVNGTGTVNLTATKPSQQFAVNGIVRNVMGRNMSNVPILLNGENIPVTTCDKGGLFSVPNLSPGDYTFSANILSQLGVARITLLPSGAIIPTKNAAGTEFTPNVIVEGNRVRLQPIRSLSNPSAPKS